MKTVWEYSIETEALRILHCAQSMASGFYRKNGFNITPYPARIKNSSLVIFPDLPYHTIPRFWKKVETSVDTKTLPVKANEKLVGKVTDLLRNTGFPKPSFTKTQKVWSKAQNNTIQAIYKIMPEKKGAIEKIVIYPTLFGTTTSFSLNKQYPAVFYIYLREDQDIYAITEALLTSLTRDFNAQNSPRWMQSEFLVDWLMEKSAISEVLKKYQPKTNWVPTTKIITDKQNARLVQESEKYYQKLGIQLHKSAFSINGRIPLYNDKPIKNLTKKEREILVHLISDPTNFISYDEIGEILFENPDDFSLYAISKAIQRLRNKLEKDGISGSCIQALRGKGYSIKP